MVRTVHVHDIERTASNPLLFSCFAGKSLREEIEANQVSRLMSSLPPTANGSVRVEAFQYQPIPIIHMLVRV